MMILRMIYAWKNDVLDCYPFFLAANLLADINIKDDLKIL